VTDTYFWNWHEC